MLTRFLDWLDEAAGGLIRVTYLLAGITAVAVYFGAGHLPAIIEDPLNAALPWLLAFSLETHTYLTARRVRAAWQEKAWTALKVQLAVLAVLLAFSSWNQLQYLSLTWTPPTTGALALPTCGDRIPSGGLLSSEWAHTSREGGTRRDNTGELGG